MESTIGFIYRVYKEIEFRLYYEPVFHRFLNRKYNYYTKLPRADKPEFLKLVRDHYLYFKFIPRDKFKLTRAMKAIICCAASQMVFRLPKESLTFFTKIIVYPRDYHSMYTNKYHKGEVNPGLHLIVFSWLGVVKGLSRPDDGLNLLLHEFAHALWLEHKLMKNRYTVLDEISVSHFEELAEAEMSKLHSRNNHFFREYAFSNIEEFFALAVENFFERPQKFKTQIPEMYAALSMILHQNPAEN